MKRLLCLSLLLTLIISGCGKKEKVVKLEKGTPVYELAKDLSNKLAYLDPDKNNLLITTKQFDITTGEVLQSIYDNSGNRTNQLKQMDENRLKGIILQTMRKMAEQKLVFDESEKAKFLVQPGIIDSLLNLQYSRAGDEQKFDEMLQKSEVNIEAVKSSIRKNIIIDRYLEQTLGDQIEVTDEEIQQAYNQYAGREIATVRHILLMTQGKNETEKKQIRAKMKQILDRAKKGEDFAELARELTEDPGSKDNGGLYEDFTRGVMVKPFEDAAFSVSIGEISDIIETRYGYHILKVIARNNFKSLEEYKPELIEQIKTKKKPQAFRSYMENLKTQYEYKEMTF